MGTSPSKKYKGIIGEYLLSLSIARRILVWNLVRVFNTDGLIGRADKPDLNTGLMKTVHVLYCTCGEILH